MASSLGKATHRAYDRALFRLQATIGGKSTTLVELDDAMERFAHTLSVSSPLRETDKLVLTPQSAAPQTSDLRKVYAGVLIAEGNREAALCILLSCSGLLKACVALALRARNAAH